MHSLSQDIKQLAKEGRIIVSEEMAQVYGLPEELVNTVGEL